MTSISAIGGPNEASISRRIHSLSRSAGGGHHHQVDPLIFVNASSSWSDSEEVRTRNAAPATGTAGGTRTDTSSSFDPRIDALGYHRFSDNAVAGAQLIFNPYSAVTNRRVYAGDYDPSVGNLTELTEDTSTLFSAEGVFGLEFGSIYAGASASYTSTNDPGAEEAQLTTNDTVLGPASGTHYTGGPGSDDTSNTVDLGIGGILAGDRGHFGVGFKTTLASTESVALRLADTDADSFFDTVVTEEAFQRDTTYGNSLPEWTDEDSSQVTRVNLTPSLEQRVADRLSVVAAGTWTLAEETVTTFYNRTLSTDQNLYRLTDNSGGDVFDILGGVAFDATPNVEVRGGVIFSRDHHRYFFEDQDATGSTTVFTDPNNSSHYPEVTLGGTDPDNDGVRLLALGGMQNSLFGIPYSERITSSLGILLTMLYEPADNVILYCTADGSLSWDEFVYSIWDLTASAAWTERQTLNGHVFDGNLGVGFGVWLNDDMFFSVETGASVALASGSQVQDVDQVPISNGTPTTSETGDLITGNNPSFPNQGFVNVSFAFSLPVAAN